MSTVATAPSRPEEDTSSAAAAAPLLSICLPTYNRSAWLHAALANIVPQATAAGGLVEVIVSDNASPDDTTEVVRQIQATLGPVRYSRNETNIGAEPNYHKAVGELARGKYAWLLGDDDFLVPGAVEKVIAAIQQNPGIEYLYVNYHVWICSTPPTPGTPFPAFERDKYRNVNLTDKRLDALMEIVGQDPNCFTPMSCSIMPREKLAKAVYRDPTLEPFASAQSVSPISMYIARNCLRKSAYCFGEPLTMLGTASSWDKYHPAFILIVYPELFDTYEKHGAPPKVMDEIRRQSAKNITEGYRKLRTDPAIPGHKNFSLPRYLWLNRRVSDAYLLHYRAFIEPRITNALQSFRASRFILHRIWLVKESRRVRLSKR